MKSLKENLKFNSKEDVITYNRNKQANAFQLSIKDKFENNKGITCEELVNFIIKNKLENLTITVYNSDGEDNTATHISHDGKNLTII